MQDKLVVNWAQIPFPTIAQMQALVQQRNRSGIERTAKILLHPVPWIGSAIAVVVVWTTQAFELPWTMELIASIVKRSGIGALAALLALRFIRHQMTEQWMARQRAIDNQIQLLHHSARFQLEQQIRWVFTAYTHFVAQWRSLTKARGSMKTLLGAGIPSGEWERCLRSISSLSTGLNRLALLLSGDVDLNLHGSHEAIDALARGAERSMWELLEKYPWLKEYASLPEKTDAALALPVPTTPTKA